MGGLFTGAGPTVVRAMALNMGMLASNDQVCMSGDHQAGVPRGTQRTVAALVFAPAPHSTAQALSQREQSTARYCICSHWRTILARLRHDQPCQTQLDPLMEVGGLLYTQRWYLSICAFSMYGRVCSGERAAGGSRRESAGGSSGRCHHRRLLCSRMQARLFGHPLRSHRYVQKVAGLHTCVSCPFCLAIAPMGMPRAPHTLGGVVGTTEQMKLRAGALALLII